MVKKEVTMSDVAKELGISTVSVSNALAGKEGVSDSLRKTITEKAAELGYRYAGSAKEPEREHHNIGIIISEHFITKDVYYSKLYEKTMLLMSDKKQIGLLEIIKKGAENALQPPVLMASGQIEGVIVLGQMSKAYLRMLRRFNLPILYMDFYDEDVFEDAVISDSVFGSGVLTRYLIQRGHKRIAFVGSIRITSSIMDRYIGYYRAMLTAGLPIEDGWLIEDRDAEGSRIPPVLPDNMPTAFVCNSDATAFELVKQLLRAGYRVPEDISVVGFDNFIYAEMSTPGITTYGVDMDALARGAIKIMVRKLEDKDFSTGRVLIAGSLVERESVKAI